MRGARLPPSPERSSMPPPDPPVAEVLAVPAPAGPQPAKRAAASRARRPKLPFAEASRAGPWAAARRSRR